MKRLTFFLLAFAVHCSANEGEGWFRTTCVKNVESSLAKMSGVGVTKVIDGGEVFNGREYSSHFLNLFGMHNHFQGVVYLQKHNAYVLSGGDGKTSRGSLFVASHLKSNKYIASRRLTTPGSPELWHAGGIALVGSNLIVPVERLSGRKFSKIYFYKLNELGIPELMPSSISINYTKTGAVDVVFDKRLRKYFLVAFDTKSVSIFKSKSEIFDGKFELLGEVKSELFRGSNIKLIQQCDGKYFVAEITNDGLLPPIINGSDIVSLYQLELPDFKVTKISEKTFECDDNCSFRGAVTLLPNNDGLEVISTKIYRDQENKIYLKHFY